MLLQLQMMCAARSRFLVLIFMKNQFDSDDILRDYCRCMCELICNWLLPHIARINCWKQGWTCVDVAANYSSSAEVNALVTFGIDIRYSYLSALRPCSAEIRSSVCLALLVYGLAEFSTRDREVLMHETSSDIVLPVTLNFMISVANHWLC